MEVFCLQKEPLCLPSFHDAALFPISVCECVCVCVVCVCVCVCVCVSCCVIVGIESVRKVPRLPPPGGQ